MKKVKEHTPGVTRVNFRLKFSYIVKFFKKKCLIIQNLQYTKVLLRKHDEDPVTTATDSGHLGYRKVDISDFRTPLIFLAKISIP